MFGDEYFGASLEEVVCSDVVVVVILVVCNDVVIAGWTIDT